MRLRRGQVVCVRLLDHVEDGSAPIEFDVYGRLGEVHPDCLCVDAWAYADRRKSTDDNVKRFTIVRSAIKSVTQLREV